MFNLLSSLAPPNRQKAPLLNQAGFVGGGAPPYEGGGATVGVEEGKGKPLLKAIVLAIIDTPGCGGGMLLAR